MITLQIENTSLCNAACFFCPYPSKENTRPKTIMKTEVFNKLVDEVVDLPLINEIYITGLGETTLDTKLVDKVAYARNKLPEVPIVVYTNGTNLSPAKFDALREAGLSSCIISLNAINQEQHTKIMGLKGQFEKVVRNAQYATLNAGSVFVQVRGVVDHKEFTLQDAEQFYRFWGPAAHDGKGQLISIRNWGGIIPTSDTSFDPKSCCDRAIGNIYVTVDGTVTACCFDPFGKMPFGNINTQSIRSIYNSSRYTDFREAHSQNRADEFDICRGCSRV